MHENVNEMDITVVVNGQPTTVKANLNAPLRTIIPKALEQRDRKSVV